ncbi:MAG: MFS transporter [Chloroflexi bacterium]|nr:MFS transporter [Chloroflexota bacterium]MCI0580141.1 MFS transporter [Chloroflexota bacterium]MCI0649283.1 MFS transporter [Chloroflexota bacterium]MCI0725984.1 MFS transporter [Chloroflexota bacterium]
MDFIARPSITGRRAGRLGLFGLLYFVQGALFAYVLVFNNLYLRAFGASAGQLAWLNGLLVVPFILKIGIGLLSDRVNLWGRGHRVPYIATGLLLTGGGALVASFIPPVTHFGLFLTTSLAIAFGVALFDTTTDGLAVDVTPAGDRTAVQGVMAIGRSLGLVMLAAVYGRLIEAVGWTVVFWAAAFFTVLPLPLLWQVREPLRRPAGVAFEWPALDYLWRPAIRLLAVYAIVYSFVVYGANAIVTLFAREGLEASYSRVGDAAAFGGLGMLGGGLALTLLGRWWSIWQRAVVATAAVSVVLLALARLASLENIILVTMLWGFCLTAADLVYVTLAMARSHPRLGASTFALFMAVSNVGTAAGQATTTWFIHEVDYRQLFVFLAVVNLLCFPLLAWLRARERAETTETTVPGGAVV